MKRRFLLTKTLFLGLAFGSVTSDLFASAEDGTRLLNEQMSDARRQGQSIQSLAKIASALLSSETLRLNLEHYVSDVDRNIAQDTIFNKVIGGFHQECSQTNDPLDSYYVTHMGFIALNHLAALNLVTQKAGFLYDEGDHIPTLLKNRLTLFDQYIKIKNKALRTSITNFDWGLF